MTTPTDVREIVKQKYGAAARSAAEGRKDAGCCSSSETGCDPITSNLYDAAQLGTLPVEAVIASLGCGNPTALAELKPGEVVLDLGSGGGIDVLLSARRVGPTGKAYGLDMTDDMLALARENQRKSGIDERRVPQGRDRAHPAARQLGRRHHLELRHQPLGRQGPRARRGVPRAEARRPLRGLRRRRARRRCACGGAAEHGAVDWLRRRRAGGRGVSNEAGDRWVRRTSTSSRRASTAPRTRGRSLMARPRRIAAGRGSTASS